MERRAGDAASITCPRTSRAARASVPRSVPSPPIRAPDAVRAPASAYDSRSIADTSMDMASASTPCSRTSRSPSIRGVSLPATRMPRSTAVSRTIAHAATASPRAAEASRRRRRSSATTPGAARRASSPIAKAPQPNAARLRCRGRGTVAFGVSRFSERADRVGCGVADGADDTVGVGPAASSCAASVAEPNRVAVPRLLVGSNATQPIPSK